MEQLSTPIAYIYILKDPETKEIRYVGKSVDPKERYENHVKYELKQKTYKANWIKSLVKRNKYPIQKIVEIVESNKWEEREKYWVRVYKKLGCKLTNGTEGGQCTAGIIQKKGKSYRKEKILKGRNHTELRKDKIAESVKKDWNNLSNEQRQSRVKKMQENRKPLSDADKAKKGEAIRGLKRSNSSSKYIGVSWTKADKRWVVQIFKNRQKLYYKAFKDELEAAKAYNENALLIYGPDCKLNQL